MSIQSFHHYVNVPYIKDTVKDAVSAVTFVFGIWEISNECYDCYHSLRNRAKVIKDSTLVSDYKTAKIFITVTKVSIILSAMSSRQGQTIGKWTAERIFTQDQLLRYFGPNLNFETTPTHPRHLLSFAAFILGLPATIKVIGEVITRSKPSEGESLRSRTLKWMAVWNTVTSRPALHLGNALVRKLF
jgi:hypothetical protein